MNVISDMESYNYEIESVESADLGYDEEVLCAGWNREALAMGQQLQLHTAATAACNGDGMPGMLGDCDLDNFLERMYWSQE